MNYEWLDGYLLSKTGAVKELKPGWDATTYLIHDKIFAMMGSDKEGLPIVSLKCEPMFSELLRNQYKHIIPGYYLNKMHWNSVYLEGDTPDDVLRDMADQSYQLIFAGLSKKAQKEIIVK